MKKFTVTGSQKTPSIDLDESGVLRIGGRSIHEDPDKFYEPVVNWIDEYCDTQKEKPTIIEIELEYFNSGSAKFILSILQTLTSRIDPGDKLTINWHYEEGDYDILERGEYYSSLLKKEFVFIKGQDH